MNTQTITQGSNSLMEAKFVRVIMILMLLALLSACGSKVTPRASALYSGSGPTDLSTISPTGDGQAECSLFDSTSTRLGGKVTTYYYNGVLQEDKVRVRVTSLVEAFDTNSNYYIQAFRWKVVGGSPSLDSTPLQFSFEKGSGSASPISAPLSSVSGTTLARIRTEHSLGGSGAVDFFNKTTMVVSGVDYNWQAMKVVVYDGSNTPATVVGQADFLLPVIQANPNRYALTHDSVLNNMHPFWSQRTQTLTESEWSNRAASYCF
ncbi:MAG: hypothetical protein J0L82_15530 [Deltaproteobacteria bacterium]|jgi:hypothetical protein|nr:hypothetical protein [Deltaproteobacteria bacterium]